MRHRFLRVSLFTLLVAACADDAAPPAGPAIGGDGSRIHRSDDGALTAPAAVSARTLVRDFLAPHVGAAADQLAVTAEAPGRDGVTHVRFEQTIGGLRVHGAYVKAAISANGELVQVIEKLAPASGLPRAATIKAADALAVAMHEHGFDVATPAQTHAQGHKVSFAKGTEFYREPWVERVAYVDEQGSLRQGYLVETWSERGNQLDHTLVGATGKVVSTERRTANDSYHVFAEDPHKSVQATVSGPGSTTASPAGWLNAGNHRSIAIAGNNVAAYLDADNNGAADAGGTTVADGNFLAVANLEIAPTSPVNRDVAVQNLFYLNNVVHDLLYTHGFTEAEGNFQEDNFGRGGAGSDSVNAEAQDGGGTDNANFSTPSDGSNPRMQMYLWTGDAPSAFVTVNNAEYGAYQSSFGPALTTAGTNGALALVNDGTGTTSDGCEASPANSLTGKIALVDRGTCDFVVKVKNAQAAGAVAVVIANNVDGKPFSPGGTDRKIKIPSAMVSKADGATLRTVLGLATNLRKNETPALQVDGDLDSDIVYHEYGHGLTWRMVGSMSGPLAGALGEGASDTLAFLINGDDRIGEYSYSDPNGIRRAPYAGYPNTYSDVTGSSVHNDGEIYAGAMWRVLENYLAAGLTANDVLGDFVQGLKFTPAGPAFEDMRDGMLAAAPAARDCLIWRAFAAAGIGVGADGVVTKGGRAVSITESFAVPAECQ